ncbi:hypothetical protein O7635_27215 [Asanoa sp. WMMD1127]|uniref:hypothetical protein n=1 Tax=Asanoa sp. WMMD1127 TaxID=3016107 RepID=UPI002416C9F1|nr:hypothetical protein [Asanoa sp. WMMD1127]MDG4825555.1 hypothetical protein [Asanoa sp. WMMD1127]
MVSLPDATEPLWRRPRRLVCDSCGHAASWAPSSSATMWGGPVDPFFRRPLWLRAECCGGHTLWAFNRAHLDLLAEFVGAGLRERARSPHRMTMVARLPAWLKAAKHRDEVMRVLTRLRTTLD